MRARSVLLVIALAVGATACGSGEAATPPSGQGADSTPKGDGPDLSAEEFTDLTAEAEVTVIGRDNSYVEPYIEVKAGTPITFTNKGRTQHNVLPVEKGAFEPIETADWEPGEESVLTLEEPGDYAYYCSLHGTTTKGMVGAVRVLE